MARKRMLPPEMFTSATVSSWPVQTRWTWAGMSCYLDDYGYGEDSPALVKAAVWPRDSNYTERKVKTDIDRIVAAGSLCRFVCCSKPQLHATSWSTWQKPSHPTPTRMCPCPTHSPDASRIHQEEFAKSSGAAPHSVVKASSEERSSGDESDDQPPSGSSDHAADKCPAPRFCIWHREQAS